MPQPNLTTSNPSLAHVQIGSFQASLSQHARPILIAVILVLALSTIALLILDRSSGNSGAKLSEAVTTLGPFQFDVSPNLKSKATVTPIITLPINSRFTATNRQTVEVACNEGTRYRAAAIRRTSGTLPTPLPLRFRLIVDGDPADTYTVGTKFLIGVKKLGATRASHTLGVEPLDVVPNSTMTFSCVTIVAEP